MTVPPQERPTRIVGPSCRSSTRVVAATSSCLAGLVAEGAAAHLVAPAPVPRPAPRLREPLQGGLVGDPDGLALDDHVRAAVSGVTCGRPSARTLVIQQSSAVAMARSVSAHGVAVAVGSLERGSSEVAGAPADSSATTVGPPAGPELVGRFRG